MTMTPGQERLRTALYPRYQQCPGENVRSLAWLTVCPCTLGYKEGDERIPESRRLQQKRVL